MSASPPAEPSESPEALRAALRELEGRIAALDETRRARAQVAHRLAEAREARRLDRERAIAALGALKRVPVCETAAVAGAVRPKRCPGCGVMVVDPRGLDRAEIARRLGTDARWLARSDGLLSALDCVPIVRARTRRRWLTRAMLGSSLIGFVLGRWLTLAG
jgi:hypothetical protein